MQEERIYRALDRIESKLDNTTERITTLEVWQANITGKLTVIVAFLTISLTLIIDTIKRRFFS